MGTRISYPKGLKLQAVQTKLKGIPTKMIVEELNIRNDTQVETWVLWYKNGEMYRFEQPVGKQYSYEKGPEKRSEIDQLKQENRF